MIGERSFAGGGSAVVLVEAKIHRCGCTTAATPAGYPAEARFCPEGLRLARDLARTRHALRELDFDAAGFAEGLRRLDRAEKALGAHRSSTGVAVRTVRPYDPRNAFVPARPRPSAVRPESIPPRGEGGAGSAR